MIVRTFIIVTVVVVVAVSRTFIIVTVVVVVAVVRTFIIVTVVVVVAVVRSFIVFAVVFVVAVLIFIVVRVALGCSETIVRSMELISTFGATIFLKIRKNGENFSNFHKLLIHKSLLLVWRFINWIY